MAFFTSKGSFSLIGLGAYLLVLVNVPESAIKFLAIGFLILIMILNIFGVKKVGKVQLVLSLIHI